MAKLSNRTFGVEFELFFEEKDWDRFQYDYGSLIDDDADEENYGHTFLESVLREIGLGNWNVHEDGSIYGGHVQAEIVTPILRGQDGLKQVIKFCNIFKKYAKVNETTGLHVHVDAKDFINESTAAERLTMALLHYGNIEDVFDSLVLTHRKKANAKYALPSGAGEEVIERYRNIIALEAKDLKQMLYLLQGYSRYNKINLQSLSKHGTVEFRQMHGTLNTELVKNWIIICTTFLDQVVESEKVFTKMFQDIKANTVQSAKTADVSDFAKMRAANLIIYYFRREFIDLVHLYNYKNNVSEDFFANLSRGALNTVGIMNFKHSGFLPERVINGVKYTIFDVPLDQYRKLFVSGDISDNMKVIVSLAKNRVEELKNCNFVFTPSSILVQVPNQTVLQMANTESPILAKDQNVGTLAQTVSANPVSLPGRNINKLQQQTATSPLKENKKRR